MQEIVPANNFPKPETCWLSAPDERSPAFFPVFARISLGVQIALRERVPATYFEELNAYRDIKKAYPMLIYEASRPFRGRVRTELTYDVLNPETLARVIRSAKLSLSELLTRAESRLNAAGWIDIANHYQPKRTQDIIDSVQRLSKSRKCFYCLIRAESVLMNALTELGGLGALKPKEQDRRLATFEKRWSFQLRRLYPGTDFLWLAPFLLDAATQALLSFQSGPSGTPADEQLDSAP
jgi:hypothetical protein